MTELKNLKTLNATEFAKKCQEPLWSMPDAILYSCGLQIIEGADEDKIEVINNDKTAKKLAEYVCDAADVEKIELRHDLFDGPIISYNIDPEKLMNATVEPEKFILLVKSLPLDLPMIKSKTGQNSEHLSDVERRSLMKIIIGMAVKGYRYDPKAIRNEAVSDIAGDLELLGIPMDKNTIRKWLKEAANVLSD